jgi:hypothetical protein
LLAIAITTFANWRTTLVSFEDRFLPPSLKRPEDILQEEWDKIPTETVQNLYKSIPRRVMALLEAEGAPAMYTMSIVF